MMGNRGHKGGDELDYLPPKTRRFFRVRPGFVSRLKRKFWKRQRREVVAEIAEQVEPEATHNCNAVITVSDDGWTRCWICLRELRFNPIQGRVHANLRRLREKHGQAMP